MSSFNKVILMGNLTRDPDCRVLMGGSKVAKIGLAVNRRYRTRENEIKEEVTFVDVDFFGVQAETLQRWCRKGSPLLIEGRLSLDQWHDKMTGEARQRLKVVGERFQFVGTKQAQDSAQGNEPVGSDDDIPF